MGDPYRHVKDNDQRLIDLRTYISKEFHPDEFDSLIQQLCQFRPIHKRLETVLPAKGIIKNLRLVTAAHAKVGSVHTADVYAIACAMLHSPFSGGLSIGRLEQLFKIKPHRASKPISSILKERGSKDSSSRAHPLSDQLLAWAELAMTPLANSTASTADSRASRKVFA
jgi:hypothetical protein